MESAHLQEYLVLAKHRSFTNAAQELHLTQSTLSKHIAALEREFGTELFVRSKDGLSLTEAGAILLKQAAQINYMLLHTHRLIAEAPEGIATDTLIGEPSAQDATGLRQNCALLAKKHSLSEREAQAFTLYMQDNGLSAIQNELSATRDEVAEILAAVYHKLQVRSKQEALKAVYSILECY